MTLIKHELRQGRTALLIWTGAISFLLITCVFLFPEMKGEMESVGDMFGSMGAFSDAFGMDQLNFGTLIGYYAIECGNVLGLGGAFYAAICATAMLSKEEKDKTAEYLLAHPISRTSVLTQKLVAVMIQITLMNLVVYLLSIGSMALIGEEVPWKEVNLMHLAYYFLQLELGGVCFGVSAFLRKGGLGAGIGIAIMLYFANLISNITESAEFLRFITPFAYCNGADIVSNGQLDILLLGLGVLFTLLGLGSGYWKYCKKDIYG